LKAGARRALDTSDIRDMAMGIALT
jgi:hypothetical protein